MRNAEFMAGVARTRLYNECERSSPFYLSVVREKPVVSYELRATSFELMVTRFAQTIIIMPVRRAPSTPHSTLSFELRATSFELMVTRFAQTINIMSVSEAHP